MHDGMSLRCQLREHMSLLGTNIRVLCQGASLFECLWRKVTFTTVHHIAEETACIFDNEKHDPPSI